MIDLRKFVLFIFCTLFVFELFSAGSDGVPLTKEPVSPYILNNTPWADSVFNSLTLDEKIAQLFMIPAYPNNDEKSLDEVVNLISKYNIGGVIFFQGSPTRQAMLTNYYQSKAKTPLVVAMDAEWGLGMRLDSTISYPRQMMLGALQNADLIYEMGEDIARQMKRIGVQINFAPVVDINNNPDNPVISNRSFGEDRQLVSSSSTAYMMGLQNHHIFAVAKHFPGHGDTNSDSHFNLPVINQNFKRIDSLELYPFKHLIAANLGGIMIGHLNIPSIDSTSGIPSTLSKKVVTDLLRDSLQFDGLIFTDALNMRGVSRNYASGEIEVKALEAGNDVLVMSDDVPKAISKIKQAIVLGRITEAQINEACKKILILKEWAGLNKPSAIDLKNLVKDLNNPASILLNRRIIENALTVVKNTNDLIPVKNLEISRIAVVSVGEEKENEFTQAVDLYAEADKFFLPKKADTLDVNRLVEQLSQYNLIIVSVMETNYSPNKNFGVTSAALDFLTKISKKEKTILNVFAPPYLLKRVEGLNDFNTIIVSYEDNPLTREYSAQLIFGGISARGILPVTAATGYGFRFGMSTSPATRFKYTVPSELGIKTIYMDRVDSIITDAIQKKAMPGCQLIAAKNGVVFINKAYGYHTYDSTAVVQLTDLYDLASVTKVAATLPSVMKLYENQLLKTNKTLSDYIPDLKKTNKSDIVLIDVLTHQARLQPSIPYHLNLLLPLSKNEKKGSKEFSTGTDVKLGFEYLVNNKRKYKPGYFSNTASFSFSNQVADSLFALTSFDDTIFNSMANSSLLAKKEYKYSDLGFIYLYRVVNSVSKLPLPEYVRGNFYSRLGAYTMGYWPLQKFDKNRIVPTELDLSFRQQLLQGYVHDQTAALMGGVSGHAGLFSNANDLAKLFQMFLNGGTYGGEKFLEQSTIDYFNSAPFIASGNRRGLGFDKPEMNPLRPGPTCYCVSAKSFGHSGFTGTFVWADPETGLVYVFLSNRVYPSAENNKLTDMSVRSKILEVLTESIKPQ